MSNLVIKRIFLSILLICCCFSLISCEQKSSNPDQQKIKDLQDEVINLKLQNDNILKKLSKQETELEIIKQHLVPSYKAKIPEEAYEKETEIDITKTQTDATTQIEVDKRTTVTEEETMQPDTKNIPVKSSADAIDQSKTSKEPVAPTFKPEDKPSKPAENTLEKDNLNAKPSERRKIQVPKPQAIPEKLPSTQKVPNKQIPEPKNPLPVSPATSNAYRNIVYAFTDIMDHPFKQYIGVLYTINVIDNVNTDLFQPEETITKAEYLTWLYRTYNVYHKNKLTPVNLKTDATPYLFDDVPPKHWAFPYIQALANADLLTDFHQEKVLHPDDPITREELVAFTEYLQRGDPDYKLSQLTPPFCRLYISTFLSDGKDIDLDFSRMIYRNLTDSDFINRTFKVFEKNIHILIPERAVTRAQAAASLCLLDNMSPEQLGFKLKDDTKIN